MYMVEAVALEVIRVRRARRTEANFIDEWAYDPEPPLLYDGIVETNLRTQTDVAERLVGTYQRYEQMFTTRLIKHLHELERLQRMRGVKWWLLPLPSTGMFISSRRRKKRTRHLRPLSKNSRKRR